MPHSPVPAVIDAIWRHNAEALRQLLSLRADPNVLFDGCSALRWAISRGPASAELVVTLLDFGADPTPALASACFAGRTDLVGELLIHGANPNATDEDAQTPLMAAAKGGHVDVLRRLIHAGARVEAVDRQQQGALHWAAMRGDFVETVQSLLENGASLSGVSQNGPPLTMAAVMGHSGTVEILLRAGALPDGRHPGTGATALMLATERGHAAIVMQLLAAGADPNVAGAHGWTALMLAAREGHASIVNQLLAAGADAGAVCDDGASAHGLAQENDNAEVSGILRAHLASSRQGPSPR